MNLKFDNSIAGHKVIAVNDNAQWARLAGGAGGTLKTNDYAILTGWYTVDAAGNTLCQTQEDPKIGIVASANFNMYEQQYSTKSSNDAQKLVNGIIKNNRSIYENNLLCARFSSKLTTTQREQVAALQSRLEARNSALVDSGVLANLQQSYPKGYIEYYDKLQALCASNKIGIVVSTTAMIIIAAVVTASLATTAYYAYKAYYNESADDVKFSNELTKTLTEKLTAEEYQQLQEETAGLITKAKLSAKLGGIGSTLKYVVLAAIGGIAAYSVYKYIKQNK